MNTVDTTVVSDGGTVVAPPLEPPPNQGDLVVPCQKRGTGTKGRQTKADKVKAEVDAKAAQAAEDRPVATWTREIPLWDASHAFYKKVTRSSPLKPVIDAFQRLIQTELSVEFDRGALPVICLETVAQLYNGVVGDKRGEAATATWKHYVETQFGLYGPKTGKNKGGRPEISLFTSFLTMIFGTKTGTGKISKWSYALSGWAIVPGRASPTIAEDEKPGTSEFAEWLTGDHEDFGAGITGAYEAHKASLPKNTTGARRTPAAKETRDQLKLRAETAGADLAIERGNTETAQKELERVNRRNVMLEQQNAALFNASDPKLYSALPPEALPAPSAGDGETSETSDEDRENSRIAFVAGMIGQLPEGSIEVLAAVLVEHYRETAIELANAIRDAVEDAESEAA